MRDLGRWCLLAMIPLNLLLITWVWIGRLVFGVGGWFLLIYLVTIVPVLLVALLVSTVLGFTQSDRPHCLTSTQAYAQIAVWAGMFGFGLFSPDFGDTPDSELAMLTQVFGRSETLLTASYTLTLVFAAVTVVSWILLMVTLTAMRQHADEPLAPRPPPPNPPPAWAP